MKIVDRFLSKLRGDVMIGNLVYNERDLDRVAAASWTDKATTGCENSHPLNNWSDIIKSRTKKRGRI